MTQSEKSPRILFPPSLPPFFLPFFFSLLPFPFLSFFFFNVTLSLFQLDKKVGGPRNVDINPANVH